MKIDKNNILKYNFVCIDCNFCCNKKGDWNRHLNTIKHNKKSINNDENYNLNNLILDTIKNLALQNKNLLETVSESQKFIKEITPKIGNTVIHNHGPNNCKIINNSIDTSINMNVFLKEHCKDALNLTTFIESLKLNLEDLDETRQRGMAYSLGKVFLRGLRELELHKRPIHCSDEKKNIMYVRDNDEWDLDIRELQIRNAISNLSCKQIKKIKEWEEKNPNWNQTEKGKQIYAEMVHCVMNGLNENEKTKIENDVIKTLAKETLLTDKLLINKNN